MAAARAAARGSAEVILTKIGRCPGLAVGRWVLIRGVVFDFNANFGLERGSSVIALLQGTMKKALRRDMRALLHGMRSPLRDVGAPRCGVEIPHHDTRALRDVGAPHPHRDMRALLRGMRARRDVGALIVI